MASCATSWASTGSRVSQRAKIRRPRRDAAAQRRNLAAAALSGSGAFDMPPIGRDYCRPVDFIPAGIFRASRRYRLVVIQEASMQHVERREFLKLAGVASVTFWPDCFPGRRAAAQAGADFHFVQFSDTHWGYRARPTPTPSIRSQRPWRR